MNHSQKEIIDFLSQIEEKRTPPPSSQNDLDLTWYQNKSSSFFISQKTTSFFEKLEKQNIFFQAFFKKYEIKQHEIIDLPKETTIAVSGIIEKNQTFSRDSVRANNLINLVGVYKFPKNNTNDSSYSQIDSNESKFFLKDKTGRIELIFDESKVNFLTTECNFKDRKFKKSLLIDKAIAGFIGETKDYQNFLVDTVVFLGIQSNFSKKRKYKKFLKEIKEKKDNLNSLGFYFREKKIMDQACFIVFISNLEFQNEKPLKFMNLLKEFLKTSVFANKIKRIIILGNIFPLFENLQTALQSTTKTKELYEKSYNEIKKAIETMETFLRSLLQHRQITIDIMPGPNDVQSPFLPQKQFENLNILQDFQYKSYFNFVQNPYFFNFQGVNILGTSGQNIKELRCYYDYTEENSIDLMENLCYWGNICPKNMAGLDFEEKFEMNKGFNEFPNLIFTGDCEVFTTKNLFQENSKAYCKLITIPNFDENGECVLANLENFDCFKIDFSSNEIRF